MRAYTQVGHLTAHSLKIGPSNLDNFDVGISERREPTCQSATMNYTSSSPRIKKRTATQQDSNTRITTCGNDDTDGPRAPVKPHSHELSTT